MKTTMSTGVRKEATMANKPTDACWVVANAQGGFGVWRSLGAAREHIATFKHEAAALDYAQSFAVDPVAAAAPELLAALQQCQLHLAEYVSWHQKRGGCSVEIEQAEQDARAAINKATGQTGGVE
jgi:hypothetical protein